MSTPVFRFTSNRFDISLPNFGFFRLDGGAMFGSVPKNLWEKRIPADNENCIRLATRSLLVRDRVSGRVILVDVGMGEKWNEKSRAIFGIENAPESSWGFKREEITDVILTHLHFDHAGGITRWKAGEPGVAELCFPSAAIHLQRANWENAASPTFKERASYLRENVQPLSEANLNLLPGDCEVLPGIRVHQVNGHTRGQQWIEIVDEGLKIFFPTDLVPTSHHISIPYHMGYDICAETVMQEKMAFAQRAMKEGAVVVFQHDPEIAAGAVELDERGNFRAVRAA